MAGSALTREEGWGLAISIFGHATLLAVLLLRPASDSFLTPPERVEVTISDEVGMTSKSSNPAAQAAPEEAPELGEATSEPAPASLPPELAPRNVLPPSPPVPSRRAPEPPTPSSEAPKAELDPWQAPSRLPKVIQKELPAPKSQPSPVLLANRAAKVDPAPAPRMSARPKADVKPRPRLQTTPVPKQSPVEDAATQQNQRKLPRETSSVAAASPKTTIAHPPATKPARNVAATPVKMAEAGAGKPKDRQASATPPITKSPSETAEPNSGAIGSVVPSIVKPGSKSAAQPATNRAASPPAKSGGSRFAEAFKSGTPGATSETSTGAPAATIGPRQISALNAAIGRQLKPHWRGKAPEGADAELLVTKVRFRLNRDGSLAGEPQVLATSGQTDANQPQVARHQEQSVRAVKLAAPFDLPEDLYDGWKVVTTNFDRRLSQ